MTARADVVIVGLGVMGSAIAYALARRGRRVIALERGWPGHDLGSSAGESRMLRRVHDVDDGRTELAGRAIDLWRRLEEASGTTLFVQGGGLTVGRSAGALAAAAAARRLPHRVLRAADLAARWPALRFGPDAEGFLDEEAGILRAEECLLALQRGAVRAGAELRFGAPVPLEGLLDRWTARRTIRAGDVELEARSLILAVGPWARALAPLAVERVIAHWFDPGKLAGALDPRALPYVVCDDAAPFCLLPALPRGVKVAFESTGALADPDRLDRTVSGDEIARAAARLQALTGVALTHRASWVSMYTRPADGQFHLEPVADNATLVAACCGRGFKFAPALAEDLAARLA